jgi:hypothetical protein
MRDNSDAVWKTRESMSDSHKENLGLKHKLAHELRQLVGITLYLFGFFCGFRLYTRLILAEYQINFFEYGLTLLKSLALAKIILTGEVLRLGERRTQHPLIVLVVYYAVVFSAFALLFEILEHIVLGWLLHSKGPAAVLAEIRDKGWPHFIAMTMIVFFAFLPFFAFRETGRAIGEGKLHELFFKRRTDQKLPQT